MFDAGVTSVFFGMNHANVLYKRKLQKLKLQINRQTNKMLQVKLFQISKHVSLVHLFTLKISK